MPLDPDGRFHTHPLDLGASPAYRGLHTGLAVELVNSPQPGDEIAIPSIQLIPLPHRK